MKKRKVVLLVLIFLLGACSKDVEKKETIGLSNSELYFTSEASVQTVTTAGEDWTFGSSMTIDGENYLLSSDETNEILEIEYKKLKNGHDEIVKIVGEWFTIIRKGTEITISLSEARTHRLNRKERMLSLDLKGNSCMETLNVVLIMRIAPGIVDDTIGLSVEELTFNAESSVQEVSTLGESWEFSNIYVDGKCYALDELEIEYSMLAQKHTAIKIMGSWFTINRDVNKINISLRENETPRERMLTITVADGDYWDYINVVQGVYRE